MSLSHSPSIVRSGLVLHLDAANPRSYSKNVHPYPTDLYSWITTGQTCNLTRDTISSPVGNKPLKMVISGNDPFTASYNSSTYNLSPASSGQTWTASVWVKASVVTTCQLFILMANSSSVFIGASNGDYSITTDWQRISYTYTLTDALTAFVQVRLDGTNASGSGITIWWDGLQVEKSSSMSNFNPMTNTNGVTWKELSGQSTNPSLTMYNGVAYNEVNGNSIVFDGVDDYIRRNSEATGPNIPSSITIMAWIKTSNTLNGMIVSSGVQFGMFSWSGKIRYWYWSGAPNWTNYSSTAGIVPNNIWTHVAVVHTPNGPSLPIFYANGVAYGNTETLTVPTPVNVGGTNVLTIGEYSGYRPYSPFNGSLSSLQLYNRALSAAEINQNFEALRGRYGI